MTALLQQLEFMRTVVVFLCMVSGAQAGLIFWILRGGVILPKDGTEL